MKSTFHRSQQEHGIQATFDCSKAEVESTFHSRLAESDRAENRRRATS
jgi:hypothetical protein